MAGGRGLGFSMDASRGSGTRTRVLSGEAAAAVVAAICDQGFIAEIEFELRSRSCVRPFRSLFRIPTALKIRPAFEFGIWSSPSAEHT